MINFHIQKERKDKVIPLIDSNWAKGVTDRMRGGKEITEKQGFIEKVVLFWNYPHLKMLLLIL